MRRLPLGVLALLALPATAQEAGAPLSAIDWLSRSVEVPASTVIGPPEPPVTRDGAAPGVTVTPLGSGQAGGQGILPPEVTGLPADLWSRSDTATLVRLIHAEQIETQPALQDLLVTLLLAEAAPPADDPGSTLFLARVDKLLDLGALEAAQSLLESADLTDPETFRRWFDVSLLRGTESDACGLLAEQPSLAPTLNARVFCLARNGDWNAAALTLNSARALGDVTPEQDELLSRFLDPELMEPEAELAPPSRPSPLTYRIREAVGDLMPTTGLPLAFSHADLRDTVAWRARIEAAERLARYGALSENVLLGIYTAREPAASGGIWDRAASIQRLDAAVSSGDEAAAAEALPVAWAAMDEAGLGVPFARLFAAPLLEMDLDGEVGALAKRIALLSPDYETAARMGMAGSAKERLWTAIATGAVAGVETTDPASAAVIAGFAEARVPIDLARLIDEGRTGEAVLRAIAAFQQGLDGDRQALTAAIATLRAVGLDSSARRAALQYLLLDART
ncbi:hypothetical protein [Rubellimicrobium roseum]|uniref:Uncharacterized protein n=1 Tax=Rubellimicrobium roseum TaxID=687525 RepID=A0A5C4NCF3_9RHOB|nr:hypothetical protein [Rubellimicrobium roseum]TNC69510.1 hypothetical protein FHG71_13955 [Rubellimicrobium roseum]